VHYSERGWTEGLKSLWQGSNTTRYGNGTIELSAATSIASPSTSFNGVSYAFTVCLDHRLRAWNLLTGRVAYVGDILNQELDPNDARKQVIDPSHSQLIKVYGDNDENAICITYSPLGTGQFKFWAVSPGEAESLQMIDLFPENTLEPRAPTADLWTLADFSVVLDRSTADSFALWTLWKNNTTYRVQRLDFQRDSASRVQDAWANGWKSMAGETLRETPLPTAYKGDHLDATDKWLALIMCPGRFTEATIETGLAIYEHGIRESKDSSRHSGPLADRMCSIIASTVSLGRKSDGHMDYDQFRAATDAQWRRFFRLLLELDKRRGEALSLVVDPQGEMPWVILADGITAVRYCSGLERIWHNQETVLPEAEHITPLIIAAASLRESFSDQLLSNFTSALMSELFDEPSLIDTARMREFYERCDFANQIGDEEYSQLVANLGGNFQNVTPEVYEYLLALLRASDEVGKRPQLLPLAEFGKKLVVKGVQETVELHRNLCLDQLVLLLLIEVEINHGEEGIQFETATVFRQLMAMLRRLELIDWLSKTRISLSLRTNERSNSISDKALTLTKNPQPNIETVTILEGVLRHLFGLDTRDGESLSSALTEVIIQICAPDSEYETPPAVTQCFLLRHDRADLAVEYSRFAGHDPFSTYVQGRARLATNDPSTAAWFFKKAAFGIGKFLELYNYQRY
jgi:nuclear pore complex protein Nup160